MTPTNFTCSLLNCKGLASKLQEVKNLCSVLVPDIFCFTETWLIPSREPHIPNYQGFWQHRPNRVGGGIGIFVNNNLFAERVDLNEYVSGVMECMAIRLYIGNNNWIYVLNVYNPNMNVTKYEITHYIRQLGTTFLLTGDFNAHSPELDGKFHSASNTTGRAISELLLDDFFVLLNDTNIATYVDYRTGSLSCLDLIFASPNLVPGYSFAREMDVGSDHCPVTVSISLSPMRCLSNNPKRWILKNVDWDKWAKKIPESYITKPNDVETMNKEIVDRINHASNMLIKQTSGKKKFRKYTPWWDNDCKDLISKRQKARKLLELHPTEENLKNLRKVTAQAKYYIKKKKKESWKVYISSLKAETPVSQVWQKIAKIKGRHRFPTFQLKLDGIPLTDDKRKANAIGKYIIANNVPGVHKEPPNYEDVMSEPNVTDLTIEKDIDMEEVKSILTKLKQTSPGNDMINNKFLQMIENSTLEDIIYLFNTSLATASIPASWKHGITVPILKPKKDESCLSSYRQITLLNTIGKLMEKIVNQRLQYWMETNQKLPKFICGFRRGMSTTDILLRLEHKIRKGLEINTSTVVVYIDLQGAYDKIWHEGLIYKMKLMKMPKMIFRWISNYLHNRTFQVRVGSELSDTLKSGGGIPQGSVLSPSLFNIMISDMPIKQNISIYCYADDITLAVTNTSIEVARDQMQAYLHDFTRWCETWGFIMNPQKCSMQIYSKKKFDVIIRIKESVLTNKQQQRLLGVILDAPRLTFKNQIDYLTLDIRKRLDLMKSLASTYWGADQHIMRMFYIAYVRSKLDYGCLIYDNAAKSNLHKLDILQNRALRMILGARKSSPITSMEVLAHVPPLNIRRKFLKCKTFLKLLYKPEYDSTVTTLEITDRDLMTPGVNKTYMSSIVEDMRNCGINTWKRNPVNTYSNLPPWLNLKEYCS